MLEQIMIGLMVVNTLAVVYIAFRLRPPMDLPWRLVKSKDGFLDGKIDPLDGNASIGAVMHDMACGHRHIVDLQNQRGQREAGSKASSILS